MKQKIGVILSCLGFALAGMGTGLTALAPSQGTNPIVFAVTGESKKVVYRYYLLGETYQVRSGIISATDPNGKAITDSKVLLYWTSGEYVFEYASVIEHVKVYETKPEDQLRFAGDFPKNMITGVSYSFPSAVAVSGVKRTNGAPAIADAETTFEVLDSTGAIVGAVAESAASYSYLFSKPGSYSIGYVYTDAFLDERVLSVPVQVDNKVGVVSESFPSETTLYESVSLSGIYGLNEGERYPVTTTCTTPSNETVNVSDSYIPEEVGDYVFHFVSSILGTDYKKDATLHVLAGGTALLTARDGLSDFGCGKAALPSNVSWKNSTGVSFTTAGSGSTFTYAEPIDLEKLNGANLIDFATNYDTTDTGITQVDVTLIDAYDSSNKFTVRCKQNDAAYLPKTNSAHDNNVLVYSGSNGSFGGSIYSSSSNPKILTDASGNPYNWGFFAAWAQSMAPNLDPARSFEPVGFGWDVDGKMALMDTTFSSSEPACRVPLYDTATNPYNFKGFAHNKVYLKFEVTGGSGKVLILDIGGVSLSEADRSNFCSDASVLFTEGDASTYFHGAVGYSYPLPEVYEYDYLNRRNKTTKVALYHGETDVSSLLQDNAFTPSEAGVYKAVYTSANALGISVSKTISFTIDAAITALAAPTQSLSAKIMDHFQIPAFAVTGGNGTLSKSLQFKKGNSVVPTKEGQVYLLDEKTNYSVLLSVKDALGQTLEKEYPLSVDYDAVYYSMESFPKCLETGKAVTLPNPIATDYGVSGEPAELSKQVTISGTTYKPGDSYTPTTAGDYTANYVVGKGTAREATHSYSFHVRDAGIVTNQLGNFFLEKNVSTTVLGENGVVFAFGTKSKTASIEMPYATTTSLLALNFSVLKDAAHYSDLTLRFAAFNGEEIVLKIAGITTNLPKLYLNGVNTGVTLPMTSGTFPSGELSGKGYQQYALFLDGGNGRLLSSSYSTLCTFDKWMNGDDYTYFVRGGAYLSFEVSGISGTSSLLLNTVGNQIFTTTALKRGDRTIPELGFETAFSMEQSVQLGSVEKLPTAYVYDVLSYASTVSVIVNDPSGNDVSLDSNNSFTVTKTGSYSVIYAVSDGNRTSSLYYSVVGIDDAAPTLTLQGNYDSSYVLNASLTILDCTASDNASESLKVVILLYAPDDSITLVKAGDKVNLTLQGNYYLRYLCYDDAGNGALKEISFHVGA